MDFDKVAACRLIQMIAVFYISYARCLEYCTVPSIFASQDRRTLSFCKVPAETLSSMYSTRLNCLAQQMGQNLHKIARLVMQHEREWCDFDSYKPYPRCPFQLLDGRISPSMLTARTNKDLNFLLKV